MFANRVQLKSMSVFHIVSLSVCLKFKSKHLPCERNVHLVHLQTWAECAVSHPFPLFCRSLTSWVPAPFLREGLYWLMRIPSHTNVTVDQILVSGPPVFWCKRRSATGLGPSCFWCKRRSATGLRSLLCSDVNVDLLLVWGPPLFWCKRRSATGLRSLPCSDVNVDLLLVSGPPVFWCKRRSATVLRPSCFLSLNPFLLPLCPVCGGKEVLLVFWRWIPHLLHVSTESFLVVL